MAQKTVTIRLALEDADAVRRALEDLGERGQAAIAKIDNATTDRLRADFQQLVRAMDPVERSAAQLQERLDLLKRAQEHGAISVEDYARATGMARSQHEALAASYQSLETSGKLAAYQITNLGYQIQDVAVQLAGGQNPFLVLIQQGPQAAGAVGGLSNLLRLMVSPTSLVVGGLLALGGAAALVISRAAEANRELRSLQVTLRAYGSESGTPESLRTLAHSLYVGGASRDEAYGAVQEIARRSTLSPQLGQEVAGLAANMAAASGQSVADATKAIAEAIEGGYPAIRKLDDSFNLLTADELRQVRAMAEHGDKARMLETVLAALHRRFDGLREQAMGPAERSLHQIGVAWNDLVDEIAHSEPVIRLVGLLAAGLETAAGWVRGAPPSDPMAEETRRLLDLKRQRDQLAERNAQLPFATFPAEQRELDWQIAEQEKKIAALAAKAQSAASASGSPAATSRAPATVDAVQAGQERQRKIVNAAVDQYDRLARAMHGTSVERELAIARMRAEDEATEKNLDGRERERLIATRVAEARLQLDTAVADLNRTVAAEIAGTLKVANAYGISAEAVRQATIEAKADQEVARGSIETRDQIIARLRAQDDAQRRLNDAQKLADIQAQVEANQRLAAALRGNVEALTALETRQRTAIAAAQDYATAARIQVPVPAVPATVSGGVHAWDAQVEPLAEKYGVPADFVRRVMQQESGGRTGLVSSAGAVGLMQVMPATFAEVARRYGITGSVGDPLANLEAGIAYLAEQLRAFGTQDLAAAAYNAGPGRVQQYLTASRPLPQETRNYIATVTGTTVSDAGATAAGAALRQAADDASLYTRALERVRTTNEAALPAQAQNTRSIEDTVRALHEAELRNQAYDLVRRQGLAGQKDENAALEYWLALLRQGEQALNAVAAGRAQLDQRRQRQSLEDEITAWQMPKAQGELWLAGRQDYWRMVDQGGLQWSENDRWQWLEEAQRFREREQWFKREKEITGELESFGERAFSRIGEAMTQMAMEGKNAWESLRNVGKAILSELSQEVFRFAVLNPLKNMLFGQNNPTMTDLVGRLGGTLAGWFGGGSAATAGTSMAGSVAVPMTSSIAAFGIYHDGGLVGDGPGPSRSLPIAVLAGARRYHGGGWAGLEPDEVPAILQRGEAVLSRSQVAALRQDPRGSRAGGQPVTVVMNISTPDVSGFRLSQGQLAADAARAMERAQRNL